MAVLPVAGIVLNLQLIRHDLLVVNLLRELYLPVLFRQSWEECLELLFEVVLREEILQTLNSKRFSCLWMLVSWKMLRSGILFLLFFLVLVPFAE